MDDLPINLLPNEVWVRIFVFLEFKTLQFKATCVCKKWFNIIRNDSNLSGEFSLLAEDWFDINTLLLSWKKVKVVLRKETQSQSSNNFYSSFSNLIYLFYNSRLATSQPFLL